jgi:hypothetical protein
MTSRRTWRPPAGSLGDAPTLPVDVSRGVRTPRVTAAGGAKLALPQPVRAIGILIQDPRTAVSRRNRSTLRADS